LRGQKKKIGPLAIGIENPLSTFGMVWLIAGLAMVVRLGDDC
jgi:hypothetical protein